MSAIPMTTTVSNTSRGSYQAREIEGSSRSLDDRVVSSRVCARATAAELGNTQNDLQGRLDGVNGALGQTRDGLDLGKSCRSQWQSFLGGVDRALPGSMYGVGDRASAMTGQGFGDGVGRLNQGLSGFQSPLAGLRGGDGKASPGLPGQTSAQDLLGNTRPGADPDVALTDSQIEKLAAVGVAACFGASVFVGGASAPFCAGLALGVSSAIAARELTKDEKKADECSPGKKDEDESTDKTKKKDQKQPAPADEGTEPQDAAPADGTATSEGKKTENKPPKDAKPRDGDTRPTDDSGPRKSMSQQAFVAIGRSQSSRQGVGQGVDGEAPIVSQEEMPQDSTTTSRGRLNWLIQTPDDAGDGDAEGNNSGVVPLTGQRMGSGGIAREIGTTHGGKGIRPGGPLDDRGPRGEGQDGPNVD